jgi:hypothetical protein
VIDARHSPIYRICADHEATATLPFDAHTDSRYDHFCDFLFSGFHYDVVLNHEVYPVGPL